MTGKYHDFILVMVLPYSYLNVSCMTQQARPPRTPPATILEPQQS
jgi:hypothetical protein